MATPEEDLTAALDEVAAAVGREMADALNEHMVAQQRPPEERASLLRKMLAEALDPNSEVPLHQERVRLNALRALMYMPAGLSRLEKEDIAYRELGHLRFKSDKLPSSRTIDLLVEIFCSSATSAEKLRMFERAVLP